jgi:hypothetical protein
MGNQLDAKESALNGVPVYLLGDLAALRITLGD